MLSSAKKVVLVSEQHAWYFLQNYLFMPKSLHQLSCLPTLLPLPIQSMKQLKSINTCERMSESDQCQFQSQSQQESIWWSCTEGGGGSFPPTLLIWLITSVLASGDLMGRAQVNRQLCDRSRVFRDQRSRQAPEELPAVSCGRCLVFLKSKTEGNSPAWQLHLASFMRKCKFEPRWR